MGVVHRGLIFDQYRLSEVAINNTGGQIIYIAAGLSGYKNQISADDTYSDKLRFFYKYPYLGQRALERKAIWT